MGRIKINDLPKNVELTGNELKRVFGGGILASQTSWTNYPVRIFRKPPVFMEKNDDEELIFSTPQMKY